MEHSTCLGCLLANGGGQAHIVYENDWVTCILDIAPLNEGHILILPKHHFVELDELDEETCMAIMNASAMLSKNLKELFQPDGISVMQNGGKFNDLGHYHMHVFPRYVNDGFGWLETGDPAGNANRLVETKLKLINAINNQ